MRSTAFAIVVSSPSRLSSAVKRAPGRVMSIRAVGRSVSAIFAVSTAAASAWPWRCSTISIIRSTRSGRAAS
jgi:hypothetical protein